MKQILYDFICEGFWGFGSGLPVYGIIFLGKIILFAHRSSFHPHSEKTLTVFEYFALAQIVRNPQKIRRLFVEQFVLEFVSI